LIALFAVEITTIDTIYCPTYEAIKYLVLIGQITFPNESWKRGEKKEHYLTAVCRYNNVDVIS